MATRNFISPAIQVESYIGGTLVSTKRTDYKISTVNSLLITPEKTWESKMANSLTNILSFDVYDTKGNILQLTAKDGIETSYIWDYITSYPIAQITNAAIADIAHTSFESDGKGNWTFSGTPATDATAPTGKKAYTLGSSITKSGLNAAATYIVSYWKKSGTVAVNGTTPVAGKTINGWTYYEHTVANPASGLITVSGTSGVIDELRLYPTGAQMSTYTYEPLVGMTSQCDASSRITYYQYDGFNRLKTIRDQDGKVIKTLDYQYQKNINQ